MLPTVRDTTEGRAVCDAGKELASSLKGGGGFDFSRKRAQGGERFGYLRAYGTPVRSQKSRALHQEITSDEQVGWLNAAILFRFPRNTLDSRNSRGLSKRRPVATTPSRQQEMAELRSQQWYVAS